MRFTDGVIALPLLPLLIVLGALDLTKLGFSAEFAHSGAAGFWRVVVIIALVDWTAIARLTRAATLALRESGLRALGARQRRLGGLCHGGAYPAERRHAADRRRDAHGRAASSCSRAC